MCLTKLQCPLDAIGYKFLFRVWAFGPDCSTLVVWQNGELSTLQYCMWYCHDGNPFPSLTWPAGILYVAPLNYCVIACGTWQHQVPRVVQHVHCMYENSNQGPQQCHQTLWNSIKATHSLGWLRRRQNQCCPLAAVAQ